MKALIGHLLSCAIRRDGELDLKKILERINQLEIIWCATLTGHKESILTFSDHIEINSWLNSFI